MKLCTLHCLETFSAMFAVLLWRWIEYNNISLQIHVIYRQSFWTIGGKHVLRCRIMGLVGILMLY